MRLIYDNWYRTKWQNPKRRLVVMLNLLVSVATCEKCCEIV